MNDLDELLDREERSETFHDAKLVTVAIDYVKRELVAEWSLCVGDPDAADVEARERRRTGRLVLGGLAFWVVDPPDTALGSRIPRLAGTGPLRDARTATSERLAALVRDGLTAWYLYFSESNSFAYFAAEKMSFQWA